MNVPLVTIYMIAYNAEKYIAKAIDSVLSQTYKDFELLLVDDGSIDQTKTIVKFYRDGRIRYIYQEHKNFAAGMNRAIAEAKGEYILGVDSDDFIAPDYLEKMVNFAEQYPDVDYFYPDHLVLVDESKKPIGQWNYIDFLSSDEIRTFLTEQERSPIPNAGSLKRKSLFEKVGLYEEIETCEDFVFLCKNVLDIKFKRVDESGDYFYRRLPMSNSHKTEARKAAHAKGQDCLKQSTRKNKTKLLICSSWNNCWLRYFERYFRDKYNLQIYRYGRDATEAQILMAWADIVLFNWSDWFLKYWSNQEKAKDKKYIAFLRSYEIWDTNNPWEINWDNIDHLIFVNPLIQQCFLDNVKENIKGEFSTPTHFIPNGIDLDEWKFIDRKPNKKIAWVNDLSHKKGIQLLAQFAFHIPYNYSVFLAGSQGDVRRSFYFNYITTAMRTRDRIAPIRRYDNVQEFLKDKSYALCTSIVEGHPNSLLEVMACGLKPIIHNWPGALSLFPEKYVYNTIEEAVEMLKGDYNSAEYRGFIEERYEMNRVYPQIEGLF